jgi:lysophospholipase L1-like esterase
MNRITTITSNLFLISISIITTLILIEIGANYYLWQIASEEQFNTYASINQFKEKYGQDYLIENSNGKWIPHHYLGYVATSNLELKNDTHSDRGFRGEDIQLPKPEGVYRIATIGGSTTYGLGVISYIQAYPYQLQKYLHSHRYDNIEIINAGNIGYTSWESLMNLQFRVLDIDPDLIIIYHGINDTHTRLVYPYSAYRSDNSGYRAPLIQDTVIPEIWEYSTAFRIIGIMIGWTESHNSLEWTRVRLASTSYGGLYRKLINTQTYPDQLFESVPIEEMIANNQPIYFYRNMKNMALIAHGFGIDVMFTSFSYDPSGKQILSQLAYKQLLQENNTATQLVADETSSYFYDFASDMPLGEDYFSDGIHLTEAGNQLLAQLFGNFIMNTIFQDKQ